MGTRSEQLQRAFRLIHRFTTDESQFAGTPWERGAPPDRSLAIVVGDGLASRSRPFLGNAPWGDALAPYIEELRPAVQVRQFSYARPGRHYSGRNTTISLRAAGKRLTVYLPRPRASTGYIAFSLACPIFTLRLGEAAASGTRGTIARLVLVQPAFALHEDIVEAWRRSGYRLSGVIRTTFSSDRVIDLQTRLVRSIEEIARATEVHMLYWPGDGFVAYPDQLLGKLAGAGAIQHEISTPAFPPQMTDPFQQHCAVARLDEVLRQAARLALGG